MIGIVGIMGILSCALLGAVIIGAVIGGGTAIIGQKMADDQGSAAAEAAQKNADEMRALQDKAERKSELRTYASSKVAELSGEAALSRARSSALSEATYNKLLGERAREEAVNIKHNAEIAAQIDSVIDGPNSGTRRGYSAGTPVA